MFVGYAINITEQRIPCQDHQNLQNKYLFTACNSVAVCEYDDMETNPTLLEKARASKAVGTHKRATTEHIELAIAWANDEVSYSQVSDALTGKRTGGNSYLLLARALREAVQEGILIRSRARTMEKS